MQSPLWWERRARWIEEEQNRSGAVRCAVCQGAWSDLHHMSYERMGRERHSDLVALCRTDHDWVHGAYDAGRWRGMDYEVVMRRLLGVARQQRGEPDVQR